MLSRRTSSRSPRPTARSSGFAHRASCSAISAPVTCAPARFQRQQHDDVWLLTQLADVAVLAETFDRREHALPPGARFPSSRPAFMVLGICGERVAGVSHAEYVEQRLLGPLGRALTSFD